MQIHRREFTLQTTHRTDILDLTAKVMETVAESGVGDGQVLVFTSGSTAGITTIEFEPGAVSDFKRIFEEIASEKRDYAHNERWGDGNGYSHVRAALLGPSLTVPVGDGRPMLGTWQQIILCDFDNKARQRRVIVQVTGVPAA